MSSINIYCVPYVPVLALHAIFLIGVQMPDAQAAVTHESDWWALTNNVCFKSTWTPGEIKPDDISDHQDNSLPNEDELVSRLHNYYQPRMESGEL
jgi:hypothetical protein